MKRMILHTFILVATTLATLLVITNCNPVTGDNKESKIDSAPKPELTSLSIRKMFRRYLQTHLTVKSN
jgi:hypothetical protein